jgi:cysteine desulfurase/selenocysteine lyase
MSTDGRPAAHAAPHAEKLASGVSYLDNGATTFPKPPVVHDFMDRFYRDHGVNPGRSGYDLCIEAGDLVEETRRLLTQFFHGTDPSRLVFGYNATDALNLAIFGLLQPGDHAVTTHLEHNSTLRPLWHLQEAGVAVDWVDCDARGYVDPREIVGRLRPNTKAVVMNHGSNVIGTVQRVASRWCSTRRRRRACWSWTSRRWVWACCASPGTSR